MTGENIRKVHLVSLYYPVAIFAVSALLAIVWPFAGSSVTLDVWGIRLEVTQQAFAATICAVLACIGLGIIVFRDYSSFFPNYFKHVVFFDCNGINELMSKLSTDDRARLKIPSDWDAQRNLLLAKVNQDLRDRGIDFEFSDIPGVTKGEGDVYLKITRVGMIGAQKYKIVSEQSFVTHRTEHIGKPSQTFHTLSQLLVNDAAIISGSPKDVLRNWGKLIAPEFRESYFESPTTLTRFIDIVAAAWVAIFPHPDIGNQLYLAKMPDGSNIPFGYAFITQP